MQEDWKSIKSYEGFYQVSNLGRVKTLGKHKSNNSKEKLLKLGNRRGYLRVGLHTDGKYKDYAVHRLVAQAFLGLDINDKKTLVCHKNDIPIDNRVNNLFLGSHKDNTQDMLSKGRHRGAFEGKFGKEHNVSREIYQYDLQCNFIKKWYGGCEIQRELGYITSNINRVCNGIRKTAHGFLWSYTPPLTWSEEEKQKLISLDT